MKMNNRKEILSVIVSSIAGGLIIGFGLWGGDKKNEEIINKMKESHKAVEELSRELSLLKNKLEQTPGQDSDAGELNTHSAADITSDLTYLKTLLDSTERNITPMAATPQKKQPLPDTAKPIRPAESVAAATQKTQGFQADVEPVLPPEPRITSPQKKNPLPDTANPIHPAESLAAALQRNQQFQGDAGPGRPPEPQIVTALKMKLAQDGPLQEPSAKGIEKYHSLEFDYGSAAITEENSKKLGALINDLNKNPDLNIEITGYIDTEQDKEALRHYRFNEKLKTQKLIEMVKNGLTPVPVDDVVIEKNEYEKYLRMAYDAEKFTKPLNILGFPKRLSIEEIEKLMYFHINITRDGLKLFASQRALTVRDYIADSQRVNPEQLVLMQAQSLSPEKTANIKNSVVILRITASSRQ